MRSVLTNLMRPFYANPVVVRDLRVQMRGRRSYVYQGLYLSVLSLLAVVGYFSSVTSHGVAEQGVSVVEAQTKLQGFYYFIFYTLATLICLIAPALTASSITTERQRLTLDLLITTPLSSAELLVGKLVSSVAFLALLLVLSLPASTLCVLLGGATLGDVFRAYILLALDGLTLAAIGLYCSASQKKGSSALGWTYLSVFFYGLFTLQFYAVIAIGMFRPSASQFSLAYAYAGLNPYLAVSAGAQSLEFGSLHIPVWVGTALLDLLIIRALMTAAKYRMGNYGGNPVGSLRRQLLLITGVAIYGFAELGKSTLSYVMGKPPPEFLYGLAGLAAYAIPFLPSLFTPAFDVDSNEEQEFATYRISQAFRPDHSGALPFFHLWLLFTLAAIYGVGRYFGASLSSEANITFLALGFYASGIGFLFWAIARRASRWVDGVTSARSLAFGAYILVALAPILVAEILGLELQHSPFTLLYPFTGEKVSAEALWFQGVACYALGVLAFPFWKRVKMVKRAPKEKRKRKSKA